MWPRRWSTAGAFIPSLNGLPFTHKTPLDPDECDVDAWYDPWPNFGILSHCRSAFSPQLRPATVTHHTLSYQKSLHQLVLRILLADSFPCDSIVCTSAAARHSLRSLLDSVAAHLDADAGVHSRYQGRFDLIPIGVDTNRFCPWPKAEVRAKIGLPGDACVILFLGRLSFIDKADLHPLLFAFRQILEARGRPRTLLLVLAGSDSGGYLAALQARIAELELTKSVRILAQPREAHLLFSAADVFVSPADSLQESFGLSVIEAMASGVPQVVSDWNGYRETVEHGGTGFLVPTYWARADTDICKVSPLFGSEWDYDHALLGQQVAVDCAKLREYLELLIHNSDLREEMGNRSRKRAVALFSWPVIVRQYEALWRELRQIAWGAPLNGTSRMSYAQPAYFDTFKHYATRILDDDAEFEITPRGTQALTAGGREFRGYPAIRTALLDAQVLERALGAFDPGKVSDESPARKTLSEVARELVAGNPEYHKDRAKRHILWLLKQGYISARENDRNSTEG